MDALRENVKVSKGLGFEGMGCIHPRQIRVIHESFAPEEKEIERAKKIIMAFEDALTAGDATKAADELKTCYKRLDKIAAKGTIHKNAAARKKSTLARKLAQSAG